MEFLAVLLVGLLIGALTAFYFTMDRMRKSIEESSVGHLRIDRSEPDEPPRPFLELKGASLEYIASKDFVVLKVINESYISHD